jgi:predicted CXXCH cytochrome family protein
MNGSRKWFKLLTAILFLTGIISMVSCSPPCRTRILSFFFDGVEKAPNAGTVVMDSAATPGSDRPVPGQLPGSNRPAMVVHPVYQDRNCSACHDSEKSNALVVEVPDLCYQCHENFSEDYEFVHMPVESGECLFCHNPHFTGREFLLVAAVRSLCFQCHDEADLQEKEPHNDLGDAECTTCHNPHAGSDETLLN